MAYNIFGGSPLFGKGYEDQDAQRRAGKTAYNKYLLSQAAQPKTSPFLNTIKERNKIDIGKKAYAYAKSLYKQQSSQAPAAATPAAKPAETPAETPAPTPTAYTPPETTQSQTGVNDTTGVSEPSVPTSNVSTGFQASGGAKTLGDIGSNVFDNGKKGLAGLTTGQAIAVDTRKEGKKKRQSLNDLLGLSVPNGEGLGVTV